MICKTHTKWYFVFPGRMSDCVLWLKGTADSTDMCICLSNYRFIEHRGYDLAPCYCWRSQGTLQGSYYCPYRGGNPGSEQISNLPKGTQLESARTSTGTHNNQEPETVLFWWLSFFPQMTLCTAFAESGPNKYLSICSIFLFLKKNLIPLLKPPHSFFLAVPKGMQDLSSLTRDRTHAPCNGSGES